MCGSGVRITGIAITREHRLTGVPGSKAETLSFGRCVAAPGTSIRGTVVLRFASISSRSSVSTTSVFGLSVVPRSLLPEGWTP